MTRNGLIVKGIAGFYYVLSEGHIFECKARGLFRKDSLKPLVGDDVLFEITDEATSKGYIVQLLDRKNHLIRPNVANVDQAVVMFSHINPAPDFYLLDKLLAIIENEDIQPIICLSKSDLVSEDNKTYSILEEYENAGYTVIPISTVSKEGIDKLSNLLKDKTSVLAGPSGVGKSTFVNALLGKSLMETGTLSQKVQRGKHTTRHAEILFGENGVCIVDTPGFTSYDISSIDKDDLMHLFKEIDENLGQCQYKDCMHMKEPGCHIKNLVAENVITRRRYESYLNIYEELKDERRKKW